METDNKDDSFWNCAISFECNFMYFEMPVEEHGIVTIVKKIIY